MWALLTPIPHFSFGPQVRIFTALWLFVPFTMIAFWSSRRGAAQARHTRRDTAMLILATTVIGLGVVPVAFGLPLSHWSEWLAAAAGTVTGWALARLGPTEAADDSGARGDPAPWKTATPPPRRALN
jgi:heme A synthase